ncbi:hypothetical protein CASFOL_034545 [Castilleja foliolosa]|uniref:Uncharacterized protein n=1 Tax=Castilleja foliolosa TaxID=1961234 RepID=A0ABD3BQ52_9LAMI
MLFRFPESGLLWEDDWQDPCVVEGPPGPKAGDDQLRDLDAWTVVWSTSEFVAKSEQYSKNTRPSQRSTRRTEEQTGREGAWSGAIYTDEQHPTRSSSPDDES